MSPVRACGHYFSGIRAFFSGSFISNTVSDYSTPDTCSLPLPVQKAIAESIKTNVTEMFFLPKNFKFRDSFHQSYFKNSQNEFQLLLFGKQNISQY